MLLIVDNSAELIGNVLQKQTRYVYSSYHTFWYVIPTLPMFLLFPLLHQRLGFVLALLACVVLTAGCFLGFALLLKRFGIVLM